MNTDIVEGKWKQIKGEVKRRWSELTEEDLDRIDGKKDKMIGTLQEKYGKSKEEAQREFKELRDKLNC